MKKLIAIFLGVAILAASSAVLSACGNGGSGSSKEKDESKAETTVAATDKGADVVADWVKKNESKLVSTFGGEDDEVTLKADGNELLVEVRSAGFDGIPEEMVADLRASLEADFEGAKVSDLKEEFADLPDELKTITVEYCNTDGELFHTITIG